MEPMLGIIVAWPANWAPVGWALCNGQALSVQQYTALFSIIGTTYGGDGRTTFNLPNLNGRVMMGPSPTVGPAQLGAIGGNASSPAQINATGNVTIGVANLPAHSHAATFTGATGTTAQVAIPVDNDSPATDNVPDTTMVLGKGVTGSVAAKTYSTGAANSTLKPFDVTLPAAGGAVAVQNTGNGTALPVTVTGTATVPTLPPYIGMNFIIAVQGLYPDRP